MREPLYRMRLLREMFRAIRTRVGDDFPVLISRAHYESWPGMILGHYKGFIRGQITEGSRMSLTRRRRLAMLAAAPVIERAAERLAPGGEGFNLPQAEQFTARLDIPVICVAGFHTREGVESAIDCYVEPIRIQKNHMLRWTEQA